MAPGRSMWPDPVTEWDRHSTPALASRRAQRGRSRPPAPAPAPAPGREAVGTGVCDTLPLACQRGSASPYMDSNLFMYDEGLLWDSHGSSCWRTPPSRWVSWEGGKWMAGGCGGRAAKRLLGLAMRGR